VDEAGVKPVPAPEAVEVDEEASVHDGALTGVRASRRFSVLESAGATPALALPIREFC